MSQRRANRRRTSRSRHPVLDASAGRRRKEKDPIPEIWEPNYRRLDVHNPDIEAHDPEYHYILDVMGERVCIIESRVVEFQATSAVRIDGIKKVNIVQRAENLWTGPQHYLLTHALRVLQACTLSQVSPDDLPDFRRLRPGITARELLKQTGLPPDQTDEVIKTLKRMDLVTYRKTLTVECWFIHTTFRGIGPNLEKFTMAELFDGWALPGGEDVPEEIGSYASPLPGDGGGASDEVDEDARLEMLRRYYAFAVGFVSDAPEIRDGYAVFTTPAPLTELAAVKIGITKSNAGNLQASLAQLNVLRNEMVGAGRWVRFIKLGVEITRDDVETLRRIARQKHADRVARTKKVPQGALEHLKAAYEVVLEQVPEGLEPDKEGYVEFETRYSFSRLIEERIEGLTELKAGKLHTDLSHLRLLITTSHGGASKWRKLRRVKIGYKITVRDIEKLREIQRGMRQSRANGQAVQPVTADSSPDEIEQIFADLAERMDGYVAEIDQLKAELEERGRQLAEKDVRIHGLEAELATKGKAKVKVPDALRRHLEKDK